MSCRVRILLSCYNNRTIVNEKIFTEKRYTRNIASFYLGRYIKIP